MGEEEEEKEVVKNHVLETFHKEQKRYAEVKASRPIPKQKASREEQTMALLAKFKAKLSGFKAEDDEEETKENKEGEEKTDEKKEDTALLGWAVLGWAVLGWSRLG